MIPNSPSIISLSFCWMALSTPLFSIFSVNSSKHLIFFNHTLAFTPCQSSTTPSSKLLPMKVMFVILQIFWVCVALYKVSNLGLLPTTDADWLPFYHVAKVRQRSTLLTLAGCPVLPLVINSFGTNKYFCLYVAGHLSKEEPEAKLQHCLLWPDQ
jgi:hypothetical protein